MNIHKFLNKIILISAALFWAGCSGDSATKASSDNEEATAGSDTSTADSGNSTVGDKSSSSTIIESSSSNSGKKNDCKPIDYEWPIDYRDETYKGDPKEPAENSADKRAQTDIRDSVLQQIFHEDYVYDIDQYPDTTTFCLFKMADTLEQRIAPLYGAFPADEVITKTVYCPDGTTHFTEEYLSYEEDLKAHKDEVKAYEEQKAAYQEAYDKHFEEYYNKRAAELKALLDSCVNHPDDFKPADNDEGERYCNSLDLIEYDCSWHPEEDSSSSKEEK